MTAVNFTSPHWVQLGAVHARRLAYAGPSRLSIHVDIIAWPGMTCGPGDFIRYRYLFARKLN